jgi:hypothetical protein
MATIAATLLQNGDENSPRIYKFEAVECITGDDTEAIVFDGFDYAITYSVVNSATGASGTGNLYLRAVSQDGGEAISYRGRQAPTASTGDLVFEDAVALTAGVQANNTGCVITELPSVGKFVHDGGNGGTALTVDIIVELHQ